MVVREAVGKILQVSVYSDALFSARHILRFIWRALNFPFTDYFYSAIKCRQAQKALDHIVSDCMKDSQLRFLFRRHHRHGEILLYLTLQPFLAVIFHLCVNDLNSLQCIESLRQKYRNHRERI